MRSQAIPRRSVLFVGALALDGLAPALGSGADIICVDLEDAVPPTKKTEGRKAALGALEKLSAHADVQVIARINSLRSLDGLADITAFLTEQTTLGAILLPKVETGDEIKWAGALADEVNSSLDLYAIIETPDGLEHCREIATAHKRMKALFFGGFDLSTALGSAMAPEPLLYARSRVVHAAASGGIEALDSPFPDVADLVGLRASAEQVKALGMVGKAAKHASQIETIRDVFTPTAAEAERAHKILSLFEEDPTKPLVFEGKLVELPTIKRLRRTVQFACQGG